MWSHEEVVDESKKKLKWFVKDTGKRLKGCFVVVKITVWLRFVPDVVKIGRDTFIIFRIGILPKKHGSVLFTRGQTQAIELFANIRSRFGETPNYRWFRNRRVVNRIYHQLLILPQFSVGSTGPNRWTRRSWKLGMEALGERA